MGIHFYKQQFILLFFSLAFLANSRLCAQTLSSTHLPIILIETAGQSISSENKVEAQFKIIDNANGQLNKPTDLPAYEGLISIRLRGHYSSILPQKPYAIETLDPNTGLDTSVSLLGMPAEEDWILLANWNDKSLIRNTFMFDLARAAGQWAPHTRHVELLLNGHYEGIYVFCEKIKRDAKRVNIKKLKPEDSALPQLSGGYIFKRDYAWDFTTDNWHPQNCPDRWLNFEIVYPDIEDITTPQLNYIAGYMDDAESALFSNYFRDSINGYRQFLDMPSWVDYFLLSELSGNVDAYKKSMFFHKDRGGRLKLGPIWDFDWAMKFLLENEFPYGSGWLYKVDPCTQDVLYVPYFNRLLEDSTFQKEVCARWQFLRNTQLDSARVFAYIDSAAQALDLPKTRHFQRWACLGYDSGAPELGPFPTTYGGEVQKLKQFLRQRLAWMDANIPAIACSKTTPPIDPPAAFSIELVPNISHGDFLVKATNIPAAGLKARIFNAQGQHCATFLLNNGETPLDLNAYPVGSYYLQVVTADARLIYKLFVAR